ncbi:MAG: deoxyuridine 5'-triphosphate nucleotidohydrolase [Phenylobacterium sp. SCN 69-14]|nr:MAG: deoxyuridine 5'-triphosphate nucleotidohydrolase [Phenylobacterium sp. SCN 69-14]
MTARFKRWEGNPDLPLPAYATAGAAGFDFRAATPAGETVTIAPGARKVIPTGFAVALPVGYELQVRPRSGLAVKNGISIVNAPGTVDCDYRGEIMICLINLGAEDFHVRRGDRIAQGIIAAAPQWELVEVQALDETVRGAGGHGSTGV